MTSDGVDGGDAEDSAPGDPTGMGQMGGAAPMQMSAAVEWPPVLVAVPLAALVVAPTAAALVPIITIALLPVVVGVVTGALKSRDSAGFRLGFAAVLFGGVVGIAGGITLVSGDAGVEAWGVTTGAVIVGSPVFAAVSGVIADRIGRIRHAPDEDVEVTGDLPD